VQKEEQIAGCDSRAGVETSGTARRAFMMASPSLYAGMITDSSDRSVMEAAQAVGSGDVSSLPVRPRNKREPSACKE
jgi:hypothetical protein